MRSDLVEHLGLRGIGGSFVGATDQDFGKLEQYCRYQLPEDYKAFLKSYGASLFTKDVVFKLIEPSPWANDGVQSLAVLYGISSKPGFDLINQDVQLDADLPEGMIAIGHDEGGSHILMRLADGHIFFCDKETRKTYLIAETFTAFLDSFYKLEQDFRVNFRGD